MRTIRMLEDYPALSGIFDLFAEDEMSVFLDSSLQNELGQYSIVGVFPYLTLKNGDKFTVNGEECGQSFEAYVKEYLENHRDENDTGLPIVSGAVGYFSYDYGREKEGVESCHKEKVDIPACILCFYDVFLVESHKENRLYLIANGKTKDSGEMLDEILKRIREVSDEEEEAAACEIQTESDFDRLYHGRRYLYYEYDPSACCTQQAKPLSGVPGAAQEQSLSLRRVFPVWGFSGGVRFAGALSPDERRPCRDAPY